MKQHAAHAKYVIVVVGAGVVSRGLAYWHALHGQPPGILALAGICAGVGYAGRYVVHLMQGYASLHPERDHPERPGPWRLLNLLMVVDAFLCCGWIGGGLVLRNQEGWTPLVFWACLYVLVLVCSAQMVRTAKAVGKERGTEFVARTGLFRWLVRTSHTASPALGATRTRKMLLSKTRIGFVSTFVVWMLLPVAAGATSNGALEVVGAFHPTPKVAANPAKHPGNGKKKTPKPQTPPPTTTTVPTITKPAPAAPPTYDSLCRGYGLPGHGAPGQRGKQLFTLFRNDGAIQAGCGVQARQETEQSSIYFEPGYCGSQVRTVGIAGPGFAVLLYQQAAKVALRELRAGRLTSASARTAIGTGDFLLLQTTHGSIALIREVSATGSINPHPHSCTDVHDRNVDYTVLRGAALTLFMDAIDRLGWVWPLQDDAPGFRDRRYDLAAASGAPIVGRISCHSLYNCLLNSRHLKEHATAYTVVTANEVQFHAPEPAGSG